MSLVRDILERPTGSGASSAGSSNGGESSSIPPPPSLSKTSSVGFPAVPHRSQRVSAFKRQRQRAEEAQKSDRGGGSASQAQAAVEKESGGPSRLTPYRPQGPSGSSSGEDNRATTASVQDDLSTATPSGTSTEAEILRSAAIENADRISRMSDLERRREQQELEEMFGAGLLERLRQRAEKKTQNKKEEKEVHDVNGQRLQQEEDAATAAASEDTAGVSPNHRLNEEALELKPSSRKVRFDDPESSTARGAAATADDNDPLDPETIRRKYFPQEAPRPAILEWMLPRQKTSDNDDRADNISSSSSSTRFDLSGEHIPASIASSLPSHHGLHHHGEDSDAAGYTLEEILTLANSSYVPQRRLMLGVVGKMVNRLKGYEAPIVQELERGNLVETAFKLSTGVLCSNERNIGILLEAVGCWSACLQYVQSPTSPPPVWITSMPIDALLDRQGPALASPLSQSALQPSSILQLLQGLLVLSELNTALADAIASVVPGVTSAFVLASSWPAVSGPYDTPLIELVLQLIVSATTASRASAKVLIQSGVYDALLRFLAIDQQAGDSDFVWEAIKLVLQAYDGAARYGLNGQILPTVINVLPALGARIASRLPQRAVSRAGAAYFHVLRTWIICATDPHAMELDHDLIWTQIEGLGWASEAADALRQVWPGVRTRAGEQDEDLRLFAAACLDTLAAWARGVSVNGVRQGEDEKSKIAGLLQELGQPPTGLEASFQRVQEALGTQDSVALRASDLPSTVNKIFQLLQGQETHAMDLVDRLLDAQLPDAQDVDHRHGVYILRPFLHYAILPNLDLVVSPAQPESKLLKVTTTLRPSKVPLVNSTWLYSPLDALLNRKVTDVWKQLPPAWDAEDIELVRATLIFARASGATSALSKGELLMVGMKVFMLETQGAKEIFRDAVVQRELQQLIRPSLERVSIASEPSFPVEGALPQATTLHQFFVELLDLYEGVSYGDSTFGQFIYPLLAQRYPADYRIALWSEHAQALRTLRHLHEELPAETGSLQEYFTPVETNQQVLLAYAGALQHMTAKSHPFLHSLACHHVSKALTQEDLPQAVKAQLKTALDRASGPAVMRRHSGIPTAQKPDESKRAASPNKAEETSTPAPSFIAPSPLEVGESSTRKIPLIGGPGPKVDDHDHALVNPVRHQQDAELGFWDRSKKRAKEDRASLDYSEFNNLTSLQPSR